MRADEFAALLNAKRVGRGKWVARCPAHPDKHPSLSITQGRKHPVIFKCMSAGCTQEEVIRAMGMNWKDILGERAPMSKELSARLRDEQALDVLRELKRALVSPAGAVLARRQYRLDALRGTLERKIVALENALNPALRMIREREDKTARFVKKWGWDKLWELYLDKNPSEGLML